MTRMTDAEIYAFIDHRPARTAKLATVKKDGSPHVAPIWVAVDGEDLVFTTHETSLKGRSLRRDPRVAMSFDDDRPPFTFAIVEGTATLSEDPDDLLAWATVIGGRYMGDERGRAVRAAQRRSRRTARAGHPHPPRGRARHRRLTMAPTRRWPASGGTGHPRGDTASLSSSRTSTSASSTSSSRTWPSSTITSPRTGPSTTVAPATTAPSVTKP